jgi:NDP-sugar pyrophosphorylase family protein
MKAMLFAAGMGTRLKPFTNEHPKALAIVNGKTLLQRNIEYLQAHGIKDVLVNVHHFADQIIDTINQNQGWGTNITVSDETNELLETGGGLKQAAWYFENEESFVVMNVDILTDFHLSRMIAFHLVQRPLATLAVSQRKSSRYFLFDTDDRLCGWKNIKTNEEKIPLQHEPLVAKAFSGVHVIDSRIFSLMHQQGKFSMVDVYLGLAAKENIFAYEHTGSQLIDVGKPESIEKAESIFL